MRARFLSTARPRLRGACLALASLDSRWRGNERNMDRRVIRSIFQRRRKVQALSPSLARSTASIDTRDQGAVAARKAA
jgi:hypothetical protein